VAIDWVSAGTCAEAAHFGWLLGVISGGIADIVIVVLIASAPKLGTRRPQAAALMKMTRFTLQRSLWLLTLIWVLGGCYSLAFLSCYAPMVAFGCAATTGVVILLILYTAANQIGARSVR
jgi:hypothetical protein